MNLHKIVYQLLENNECVIIPGFGGFIANYFNAKVDLIDQEFYPPSRRIVFNENLKNNDGLLINYIATNNELTWELAEMMVAEFVNDLIVKLKNGDVVKFDKIGQFFYKSNVLIFTPNIELNLLEESFGLASFNYPMLKTAKSAIKSQSFHVISSVKSAKTNNLKKYRKSLWVSASAVAAVCCLIFVSFYLGLFDFVVDENKNPNYTNIIPVEIVKPKIIEEKAEEAILNIETEDLEISGNVIGKTAEPIVSTEPIVETIHKVVEPVASNIFQPEAEINAYVIVGSFSSYQNAEKLKLDLRNLGYTPDILPNKGGMYRVSIKSYSNRNIAVNELESLRIALNNESLWVLFI